MAVQQARATLKLSSHAGCRLMTREVLAKAPAVDHGLLHVAVLTAGVGITLNENADPTVQSDLTTALGLLAQPFGAQKVAAQRLLSGATLSLPMRSGRPDLGTWQGIYLCNFAGVAECELLLTTVKASDKPTLVTTSAPERGTFDVDDAVPSSDADDVPMLYHTKHTSAAIALGPSKTGDFGTAMEAQLNQLVPAAWNQQHFEHTYEGPDDMPGHVKSTLIGTDVLRLSSKAWHLHLIEPRDSGGWGGGHQRRISCTRLPSSHRVSIKVDLDEHGLATQIEAQLLDQLKAQQPAATAGLLVVQADTPGVGLCIASAAEHDVLHHFAEHLNIQSQAVAGAILGHSLAIPMCEGTLCLGGDNQQLVVSAPPGTPGPIRIDALMML